jgi:Ser/Thr protein kinase RdoA (MazF antagonist)
MQTVTRDIIFLEPIRSSQNRVFKARVNGQLCAIRLTSPGHRSLEQLQTEVTLLLDLQSVTEIATSPLPFTSGEFIESLSYEGESYNATLFSYVDDSLAASGSYKDGGTMGLLMAGLHTAFRELPGNYAFPSMLNDPTASEEQIQKVNTMLESIEKWDSEEDQPPRPPFLSASKKEDISLN